LERAVSSIIDYSVVLQQMQQQGFKSLYHNSGAFALPEQWSASVVAWIGPPDGSIRPEALPLVRCVSKPFEDTLALMTMLIWRAQFPGPVWLMPMSHWAFECGQDWMPRLLQEIKIDPTLLASRNDAAAVEFGSADTEHFLRFLIGLLKHLIGSDFAMAFPGHQTLCTVHHHKQLWWSTQQPPVLAAIESLAKRFAAP
jgi:hypothetical protein